MNTKLKLALLQAGRPEWRVAIEAKLSPTKLSRIVSGQRLASDEERKAIARVLGLLVEELFDLVPKPEAGVE
jgi:hypothetical protein